MPSVAHRKLDPTAHSTAFPPLAPVADFAPVSELDALNEEDDRASRLPPPPRPPTSGLADD